MTPRVRSVLVDGLLLAGIGACVSIVVVAHDVHRFVKVSTPTAAQAAAILAHVDETNRNTNALIRDGRLTLDNVNKAAIDERLELERDTPVLVSDARALLDNASVSVRSLQPVTQSAAAAVDSLRVSIDGLRPIEQQATTTLEAANARIADPHISEAIVHLDETSAHLAGTSAHIEAGSVHAEAALQHTEVASENVEVTTGRVAHPFGWVGRLFHRKKKVDAAH